MTNFCLHQVHRTLSPRSSVHDTQWNEEKDLEKRKKKESEQKTRGMIFEASHVATMLRSSSSDLRCYTRDRWKLIEMDDRFIRSSLFLSFFLLSYLSSIFFSFSFFSMYVRLGGGYRVSREFATSFDRVIRNTKTRCDSEQIMHRCVQAHQSHSHIHNAHT